MVGISNSKVCFDMAFNGKTLRKLGLLVILRHTHLGIMMQMSNSHLEDGKTPSFDKLYSWDLGLDV